MAAKSGEESKGLRNVKCFELEVSSDNPAEAAAQVKKKFMSNVAAEMPQKELQRKSVRCQVVRRCLMPDHGQEVQSEKETSPCG